MHFQAIRAGLGHGHLQIERVTGFRSGPPQVGLAAPLVAKPAQILPAGVARRLGENFDLLALQRTFDFEDLDRLPVSFSLRDGRRFVRIGLARRLVPIRRGGVKCRLAVRVVLLDRSFERFGERDIVGDMPAVDRNVAAVAHAYCLIVVAVCKQRRIAPGVAEVILRAGAERGGEFLPVDEEFLVTLAPPAAAGIPYVQHHAAEAPPAAGLEHRPVNRTTLGLFGRECIAVPFRVESPECVNRLCQRSVCD